MKIDNLHNQSFKQSKVMYMFFARYLQKERIFKLAASVVGHPNNGEMVPPRPE